MKEENDKIELDVNDLPEKKQFLVSDYDIQETLNNIGRALQEYNKDELRVFVKNGEIVEIQKIEDDFIIKPLTHERLNLILSNFRWTNGKPITEKDAQGKTIPTGYLQSVRTPSKELRLTALTAYDQPAYSHLQKLSGINDGLLITTNGTIKGRTNTTPYDPETAIYFTKQYNLTTYGFKTFEIIDTDKLKELLLNEYEFYDKDVYNKILTLNEDDFNKLYQILRKLHLKEINDLKITERECKYETKNLMEIHLDEVRNQINNEIVKSLEDVVLQELTLPGDIDKLKEKIWSIDDNNKTPVMIIKSDNQNPSQDDLLQAHKIMLEVLQDFPFAGYEETTNLFDNVNFQNAIFALNLMNLRQFIPGAFPIIVINKNQRKVGGTFLSHILTILATGNDTNEETLPPPKQDRELQIKYDSIILRGKPIAIFDNVSSNDEWINDKILSITSGNGKIGYRKMHTHEDITLDVKTLFVFNGINLIIQSDAIRRVLPIYLNATTAASETRKYKYSKSELYKLAREYHPKIIKSIETYYNYWINQGKPIYDLPPGDMDEYKEIFSIPYSVFRCVGYTNMLSNIENMQFSESEADQHLRDLLQAIYDVFQCREFETREFNAILTAQIRNKQYGSSDTTGIDTELIDNIDEDLREKIARPGGASLKSIGKFLTKYVNMNSGLSPYRLIKIEDTRKRRSARYQLQNRIKQSNIQNFN